MTNLRGPLQPQMYTMRYNFNFWLGSFAAKPCQWALRENREAAAEAQGQSPTPGTVTAGISKTLNANVRLPPCPGPGLGPGARGPRRLPSGGRPRCGGLHQNQPTESLPSARAAGGLGNTQNAQVIARLLLDVTATASDRESHHSDSDSESVARAGPGPQKTGPTTKNLSIQSLRRLHP